MGSERAAALEALLVQTGFDRATRVPFPMDASTRSYTRLVLPERTAVLMDAPLMEDAPCPPAASEAERRGMGWNATSRLAASRVEAFAAVAQQLSAWGLSAPQIYGVDVAHGFAVLEDLGDNLYARVIPAGADEIGLYTVAAHVLARVHSAPLPLSLEGPGGRWPLLDYDRLAMEVNVDLFVEWLPRASDVLISDSERAQFERARDALIDEALTFPRAFTIRDYHAENLIWLPERDGVRRVGLLDFQDAVRGWRAWDFSMLLHDARRDVSPEAAKAAIRAYLTQMGASEAPFERELAILGALNTLRILGLFCRLVSRDQKQKYAAFMPREWGHLARTLRHPALAEMAAFMAQVAPAYVKEAA
ncbi:MAG: aminoglycoside phosphotransferase family protein [Hyphomonadaceae bacterium]